MALRIEQVPRLRVYQIQAHVQDVLADLKTFQHYEEGSSKRGAKRWLLATSVVLLCMGVSFLLPVPARFLMGMLMLYLFPALLLNRRQDPVGHSPHAWWSARHQLAAVLLQRLSVDVAPEAFVELRFDLLPVTDERKQTREEQRGAVQHARFADPWLLLKLRLADGAHLRLGMTDRLKWRSRIGSRKVRSRSTSVLDLTLRVKPSRHPNLARLTEARARRVVCLPPEVKVRRLRVTGDRLRLQVLLESEWSARTPKHPVQVETAPKGQPSSIDAGSTSLGPGSRSQYGECDASRTVTMMLLSLYQMLHVARTLPESGPELELEPEPVPKPNAPRKKRRGHRPV